MISRLAKIKKGCGICVHNTLLHKILTNCSVSGDVNETLVIEIINKTSKNIIIDVSYRPPNVKTKPFKTHLKQIFNKTSCGNKKILCRRLIVTVSIDYHENNKIKMFFRSLIPDME